MSDDDVLHLVEKDQAPEPTNVQFRVTNRREHLVRRKRLPETQSNRPAAAQETTSAGHDAADAGDPRRKELQVLSMMMIRPTAR